MGNAKQKPEPSTETVKPAEQKPDVAVASDQKKPEDKKGVEVWVPRERQMVATNLINDDPDEIRQFYDPEIVRDRALGFRRSRGTDEPIKIYKLKDGRYGRVGGGYRIRAYRLNEQELNDSFWALIPAYVEEYTPVDLDIQRLVNNAAREQNSPFEIARHLASTKKKHKLTTEKLIELLAREGVRKGFGESHVNTLIKLYEKLAPEVHVSWKNNHPVLTIPHLARLIEVPMSVQVELIARVTNEGKNWEWLESQLDKLKEERQGTKENKHGPKKDTISTKRSQLMVVIEDVQGSRLPLPVKEAVVSVLTSLSSGRDGFRVGAISFRIPDVSEVKERKRKNGRRTDEPMKSPIKSKLIGKPVRKIIRTQPKKAIKKSTKGKSRK